MLNEPVLVDTGALIALFNPNDPQHQACASQAKMLPAGKAFTCWPVITEASYLLRGYPRQRDELLDAVFVGEFELLPLLAEDLSGIQDVFTKYHDQEVDLADATLVHLAEREDISAVFTIDRRHFRVFRRLNGDAFRLLPESG